MINFYHRDYVTYFGWLSCACPVCKTQSEEKLIWQCFVHHMSWKQIIWAGFEACPAENTTENTKKAQRCHLWQFCCGSVETINNVLLDKLLWAQRNLFQQGTLKAGPFPSVLWPASKRRSGNVREREQSWFGAPFLQSPEAGSSWALVAAGPWQDLGALWDEDRRGEGVFPQHRSALLSLWEERLHRVPSWRMNTQSTTLNPLAV